MSLLPSLIPAIYVQNPDSTVAVADVDTGGYDLTIGGYGFRLATSKEFPYSRVTEPTTVRRFDNSLEPGEQTLSPIPWVKAQSSFHAGAGQQNLEQGFTAFQYQQEQIEHIRFDTCLGVDIWTPYEVKRLPDCRFYNFGFTSSCMVTATIGGIDYAVIGGDQGLYLAAWNSGADADPTVTAIDLSGTTFGGSSNCNVTSLATDGTNYFGVIQLTTVGYVADVMTYIVSGVIGSTAAPTALYECPNNSNNPNRTNLCTNPSLETDLTGWSVTGTGAAIARSTTQHKVDTASCKATWGTEPSLNVISMPTLTTTAGQTYTLSASVYVPSGSQDCSIAVGGIGFGTATSGLRDQWVRLNITFTATGSSHNPQIWCSNTTAGQVAYVDAVLYEQSALVNDYFDGATTNTSAYTYAWTGTANLSTSTATALVTPAQVAGVVGWAKARLIGCIGTSMYELPTKNVSPHSALPSARYTHPNDSWIYTSVSESPSGVLASGYAGAKSGILEFTLDTSGATPFLSGGAQVAELPPGEIIWDLKQYLSSYLAVGTERGIRVATFDTYTGNLKMGPLTVETTAPVAALTGRDRFIFGSYTNQQADGKTGLVRVDLSMVVDVAGRNAYAPDLRPPTTAPTGLGAVTCVDLLPSANRVVFLTPEGIHVEGNGPGSDGDAWIRTSRIRFDTVEDKLFKLGRLHGTLDVANIQVTGIAPYQSNQNLGEFGFLPSGDPGEFRLPSGLHEWIQLQFSLIGSGCVLNSYQVKALPAPKRQHVITFTVLCFLYETDKDGIEVTDPVQPRDRYLAVKELEQSGDEVRFVEFTNTGAVAELVVIDQLGFQSFDRPTVDDDFGGYITFKLRATED